MGKVIYREDVGEIEFELYEDFIKYLNRMDNCKIEGEFKLPFTEDIEQSQAFDMVSTPNYQPNEHGYSPPACAWFDDIDEEFEWRAVDEDGEVWYFESKPKLGKISWESGSEVTYSDYDTHEELTIDWTKTLTKRPGGGIK